jgi:uncharacterized membrane protein
MTTSVSVMLIAVFLASLVEMVEALTIVVAVGASRGWRSALEGTFAAFAALGILVVVMGPTLTKIPLNSLRLFVGLFLLIFGMQWLRKAVLRSAGLKALHDEDAIYAATVASLSASPGRDTAGFVTSFKGVFLEGIEVVVTVITLGSPSHRILLATGAAVSAVIVVVIVGLVVSRHLSHVPENGLKMTVGLMLMAYGTFWLGEGLGFHWPNGEAAILELAGYYALATASAIPYLRNKARVSA